MKTFLAMLMVLLLMTGCKAEQTMETVADEMVQPVLAELAEVNLYLPPEAVTPVLESEKGTVYECGDYEICRQDLPSGNLSATIQSVTGYLPEELTILEIQQPKGKRYDFVWASASEEGELVGKGCILDDGNYHYVLTVLGDADTAENNREVWLEILDAFAIA